MTTRAANLLPATRLDDPRCRPVAINASDLILTDDFNGCAWLACQDAPHLHDWR